MKSKSVLLGAACAAALVPAVAAAQESTLGEIIVTARKRQESILNVPVIETAIPQAKLERFQTTDLQDVARMVPGLSFGDSVLTVGTQVSLRGVGTSTLDAGVDQSVSLNLDGLQLTQGLAYQSALFDMAQVEVLKGPQALFYGKNSPGGVISIRTNDPTDRFEVILRYGHEFEANENRAEFIVSGPVNDQLRLRFAAAWDRSDGFYNNTGVAAPGFGGLTPSIAHSPDDKNYVIRGTAIWKPTDQFDARLKLNVTHERTEEAGLGQLVSCPDGATAVPGFPPFIGGNEDCKQDRNVNVVSLDPRYFPLATNGGTPFLETGQQFGTLELNYRPRSDITLTSTTGYYHVSSNGLLNGFQTVFAGPPLGAENDFSRHDVTEELRANSDFAGPLNFTAGGFFQDAEVKNFITIAGNEAIGLPALLQQGAHDLKIRSYSGFGQLRWKIVPQVELAAGARWTHEKRSDDPTLNIGGVLTPVAIVQPEISSDNLSPEVTITYKPTEDATLFASAKKGFKSGSFSITVPATPGRDIAFGDERARGAEAGVKARWLNRSLITNLSFFDYRYLGLQVGAVDPTPAGQLPITRTVNAGSAITYGVDFDAAYRPPQIDNLELHAAFEWDQAHFKSFPNAPCWGGQEISEGCVTQAVPGTTGLVTVAQDLSGSDLVRAPKWQANFGGSWERPIGNGLAIVVSSDTQYSSRYLTTLGRRADFYQASFFKTDVNLTLKGPSDRWEFALIGKNLNNALRAGNCAPINMQGGIFGGQNTGGTTRGPAGVDEVTCYMDRGREVWLRLTLRPFG